MTTRSLIFSLASGGIAHYTYCLADALTSLGTEAEVLMYDYPAYDLASLPHRHRVKPNIRMSHTHAARVVDPMRNLSTLLQSARRSDVVHYQWAGGPRTDRIQWSMVKVLRKPIVYTAHDVQPHENDIIGRDHNLWLYRNADAIIVHGHRLKENLIEIASVPSEKVYVLKHGNYNFVADQYVRWDRTLARASFDFREDDLVVLFFGMIRPYKGVDTLIEACRQVREQCPGVGRRLRLIIAGRPLKNYWQEGGYPQQIAAAGLEEQTNCIVEHIEMADIGRFFHASDIVAVPYKSGSQSGVLQLAYSFAKPVIVTDVGCFKDVIEDGKTGLLVPPDDSTQFAQALIQLLDSPENANKMGQAGRSYAETELSWEGIAAETEQVYRYVKSVAT
jgi:glycosyltransferase involved in cell wall biosynthesis